MTINHRCCEVGRILGASLFLATVFTQTAEAHSIVYAGPTNAFFQGLIHPLSGIDHWTSMLALGILAAYMSGHATRRLPIFFVVSMLLGAIMGLLPISQSLAACTEFLIAALALCIGGLLLFADKPSMRVVVLLIASAGICHGFAHGHEMPVSTVNAIEYFLGFTFTTLFVIGAGICSMNLPMIRPQQRAYVRFSGVFFVLIASNLLFQRYV